MAKSSLKELQTWTKLMDKCEQFLQIAAEMQRLSLADHHQTESQKKNAKPVLIGPLHHGPSLYLHSDQLTGSPLEIDLIKLASDNLDVYFGRACAFQFSDSLITPLTGVAVRFILL